MTVLAILSGHLDLNVASAGNYNLNTIMYRYELQILTSSDVTFIIMMS
jgi:hypothetical protein